MTIGVHDCRLVVQNRYALTKDEITSERRSVWIARPRQMAMALAREFTRASLPRIGNAFGGKDHTTVLHAVRRVRVLEESSPKVKDEMAYFRAKLREMELSILSDRALSSLESMTPEEWRAQ